MTWLKILFYTSGILSAAGFVYARQIHQVNGPSKKIADFSIFMAFALGIHLFCCLALLPFFLLAGKYAVSMLLLCIFALPFVLGAIFNAYTKAQTAFWCQSILLLVGITAFFYLSKVV